MIPTRIARLLLAPCGVLLAVTLFGPLLVVLVYSIGERGAVGGYQFAITAEQYMRVGQRASAYLLSAKLAGLASIMCLIIATPVAYFVSRIQNTQLKALILLLIALPFFTSFVVRTYAWFFLLGGRGIPSILMSFGMGPVRLLNTNFAVLMGLAYGYLPIAVLSIYVSMERIPKSLIEASADLGRNGFQTFFRIVLPLGMPGIVAGISIVFIFTSGEYLIPAMLGGGKVYFVGNAIADTLLQSRNWPLGAALGAVLTGGVLLVILCFRWLEQALTVKGQDG